LEQQHIILEQQVKERTKDLEAAKFRAEESDRLKSSFLANMSHEIRTPLNAIVGFSNVMVSDEYPDKEKKRMCGLIEKNSYSLLNIISDIIDFSKIEAGQMDFHLTKVEVDTILMELHQSFTPHLVKMEKAEDVELKIKLRSDIKNPILNTDPFRLKQIFNNLIGNAIKFTDKGSIEFGYKEIIDDHLVLFVKDTGIGIKKEHLEIVFERFRKIEEDKKTIYRGTGLGLSITKYLVELLGGKIWLESEYEKGSEFLFKLPLINKNKKEDKQSPPKKIDADDIYPSWRDKRVLVVEDEESNFDLITFLLKATGIQVDWAKDGNEAIEIFEKLKNEINIVLLDIKLPQKDGFEVANKIKNIKNTIPIVAQTAYAMQNEEEHIRQSNFDDYISKPLIKQKLYKIMSRFL